MLAEATITALKGFAEEVSSWTNQGTLVSITGHIAQIENAVAQDVHAGETAAKAVLADLYGAFHGHTAPEPAPAQAPAAPAAPTPVVEAPAAPVPADPTPAPQEAPATATPTPSSAPSNEPSTSATTATDVPAAGA